jgi:hypothetical protein
VKRREKNKEKLAGCQRTIFRKKIEHTCSEFYQEKVVEQSGSSKSEE